MGKNDIEKKHHQTFESIRRQNTQGQEFWFARDLQPVLDYNSWDKFKRVIDKAMIACNTAGQAAKDHFSHLGKMVSVGSGVSRKIEDYQLIFLRKVYLFVRASKLSLASLKSGFMDSAC